MKHIKLSVLFIASIFAITACSDDNNKKEQMTNGLDLSISGNAFMSEDDTNGITSFSGIHSRQRKNCRTRSYRQ